jgi:hypothetical protein
MSDMVPEEAIGLSTFRQRGKLAACPRANGIDRSSRLEPDG